MRSVWFRDVVGYLRRELKRGVYAMQSWHLSSRHTSGLDRRSDGVRPRSSRAICARRRGKRSKRQTVRTHTARDARGAVAVNRVFACWTLLAIIALNPRLSKVPSITYTRCHRNRHLR